MLLDRQPSVPLGNILETIKGAHERGEVLPFPDALRAYHMFISGRTGVGKSRFVDSLIQSDIRRGVPFILLDGVGASFDETVSFLGSILLGLEIERRSAPAVLRPLLEQRMRDFASHFIILNFSEEDTGWRFNVLEVPRGLKPSEVVADFLDAFTRATDGDIANQRRLLQVVRAVISVLVEIGNTTLRDALDALAFGKESWSALITYLKLKRAEIGRPADEREEASLRYLTAFLTQLSPRELHDATQSTWNALNVFLADPVAAKFFSSTKSTIDLGAAVSGDKCLLIRLPPGLDVLTQPALGSPILNRILLLASKRDVQAVATGKLPRIALYIDEVAAFAGKRFTQDLTRIRNWGIAVIAAAQHYKQPPWHTVEGASIYHAMRGNMGTSVTFRVGLDMALAEAEAIFRPRGDMVARVESEVTETIGSSVSEGSSSSRSEGSSYSTSNSRGQGNSSGSSDGKSWDPEYERMTSNEGNSCNNSYQSSSSTGSSESQGWSKGTSHQRGQSRSTSAKVRKDYYTINEQIQMHAHAIGTMPAREAYVVTADNESSTYRIRTLDVPVHWETVFGGVDYREEFLRLAAPPAPLPEPKESLDVRVTKWLRDLARRQPKAYAFHVTVPEPARGRKR